jgi:thiamine biosynthesis lipoprotein
MRTILLLLLLTATALPLTVGCERPPAASADARAQRVSQAREVMGTLATLTADAPDRATAAAAVEAGYARLADVNRLMSDYVADSEIGRLNRLPVGEWMAVSPETFTCLERAIGIAVASDGAFDVTCRPLVTLWKEAGRAGKLPTDAELAATRARVGWRHLRLDAATREVSRAIDGLEVDLGGIAKGYALDLAGAAMRAAGATAVLVDVGGDVLALGTPPDGRPWRIGIRHPFREGHFRVLTLTDRAVATSGLQQRFHEIDGQRYSHIIDPRTGRPAHEAPSVTVIARDGLTADAWATALSVLPVEEALALATARGEVEALWVSGPPEAPREVQTPGFAAYVAE